jgi:hypothetical protein
MTCITMHKRFLAATFVATALLFSQGGSFLVAALCPHMQSGTASCMSQSAEPTMSHEDMGHMDHMQMEQEPESEPDSSASALSQPASPCPHCAVHSGTTPRSASLRETEVAKRSLDFSIPLQVPKVVPVAPATVAVLISRAHGPPGDPTPRHILINIFRI